MTPGDASAHAPAPTVVIADDEPDVRMLLRFQLRAAGFQVVGEAGDGRQAIDRCEAVRPDAVVFDLLMPGMSGFAAIPAMQEALPLVGIVAYTAVAGDFVRTEMARLGVPLVLKSGDIAELAAAIRSTINRPA